MSRTYPDEPARRFERPPLSFTDEEGREIGIYEYGEGPLPVEASVDDDAAVDYVDTADADADADGNAAAENAAVDAVAMDGSDSEERNEEESAAEPETEYGALVEMYVAFDPADRAQGIPPTNDDQIRQWLDTILDEGKNVLAWHGTDAVGHATLVPDGGDAYELAIFVLHDYQRARIGSRLMEALLGHGQERGVERVWLTVERWNEVAIALYRKFGFETSDTESFELEMALRLQ